ncbi:hypothetical protein [Paenibacillus xylanilyticus]
MKRNDRLDLTDRLPKIENVIALIYYNTQLDLGKYPIDLSMVYGRMPVVG